MKLKQVRIQKGVAQKGLAKAIGTDEPMISRFENYKCLPVPQMMELLLKELDSKLEDIYQPSEIYLNRSKATVDKRESTELNCYRLTVNLPREAKEFLKLSLKKCGYKDITYWIYRCFERLNKQYEIIEKMNKEKDFNTACKRTLKSSKPLELNSPYGTTIITNNLINVKEKINNERVL